MKTLHHTETTWQGRKIIIDAFVRHGLRHYYYGLVHR